VNDAPNLPPRSRIVTAALWVWAGSMLLLYFAQFLDKARALLARFIGH